MNADQPVIDEETAPWWAAAAEGRLLIRRCGACGVAHLYPRPFCPTCWSEDVEWEPASGSGTVYTFSIVRINDLPPFADQLPYVAAIVELAEGPRMTTAIVDCEPEQVAIGLPVVVTFRPGSGVTRPVFRPEEKS